MVNLVIAVLHLEELSNDVTRSTRAMDTWNMNEDDA